MFRSNGLYGQTINRTFSEIFPDKDTFRMMYEESGLAVEGNTVSNIDLVYYLLYARYANSTIASVSEEQFAYKVFSTIFMYGPTWEKRLEIQSKVRNLTEDEIVVGTKRIHNISMNPSTAPTTDTLDELTTINQQMTDGWKKSKLEGYGILASLLTTDVTEQFIGKFKKLFITVVEPTLPWWSMEV
jgi:hypothetical protein